MGRVIAECVKKREGCQIACGIDKADFSAEFPVYNDISDVKETVDVIIDFSHPSALDDILNFATAKNVPTVLATTGYNDSEIEKINAASKQIPVFFTYNMSLGVNLIADLAKRAAAILADDVEIEIVEAHHNQKIGEDSFSTTMEYICNCKGNVENNA